MKICGVEVSKIDVIEIFIDGHFCLENIERYVKEQYPNTDTDNMNILSIVSMGTTVELYCTFDQGGKQ